jgi:hypothetical protein
MKLRGFVAGAVIAGFLSGVPVMAHADPYPPPHWGAYGENHVWHQGPWWMEHHPNWVREHHPESAQYGDWGPHHHWHDRDWWRHHDARWAHEHHPDWF